MVFLLEDKSFVVGETLSDYSAHAMGVCWPVCDGDWIWVFFVASMSTVSGCMLGDYIVGNHSAGVSNVQLPWEVVIVWELVETVTEPGPFTSHISLILPLASFNHSTMEEAD